MMDVLAAIKRAQAEAGMLPCVILLGTFLFIFTPSFAYKNAALFLGVGFLLCAYALALMRGNLVLPGLKRMVIAGIATIVVLASVVFSPAPLTAFTGSVLEQGSGIYLLALIALFFVSANVFTRSSVALFRVTVIVAAGLVSLVGLVDAAFFGSVIERGTTLAGDILTFNILGGLAVLSFFGLKKVGSLREVYGVCFAGAVLSLLFLLLTDAFPILFGLSLAVLTLLALRALWYGVSTPGAEWIFGLLVLAACAGSYFVLPSPHTPAELRPSPHATLTVISTTLTQEARALIFGTGPGRFESAWYAHHPAAFTVSSVWNEEIEAGFSTVFTRTVEWGALAIFFLSMSIVLLLIRLGGRAFSGKDVYNHETAWVLVACAYTGAWFFFYVPGVVAEVVFVLVLALGASFVVDEGRARVHRISAGAAALAGIIFFTAGMAAGFVHFSYAQGVKAYMSSGKADAAIPWFTRAYSVLPTSYTARTLSDMEQSALEDALERSHSEEITRVANTGLVHAVRAVELDAKSFRSQLTLGNMYARRLALGDTSAAALADAAYEKASRLSPQHPLPYMLRAQLAALQQDSETEFRMLQEAKKLKPNLELP